MPGESLEIFYWLRHDCRKARLHFPLTFSLSWFLNFNSLSHAFIIIRLPVFKKILWKKKGTKKDRYINLLILSSSIMTWSFNSSCISVSKRGNGVFCHFKDKRNFIEFIFFLKMETGNRSLLVNGIVPRPYRCHTRKFNINKVFSLTWSMSLFFNQSKKKR